MLRTRLGAGAAALTAVASCLVLAGAAASPAHAAGAATMGPSKVLGESFDSLVASGTGDIVTETPAGVLIAKSNNTTTYMASTGSDTGGNAYSFGSSASTERALGQVRSGSNVTTLGYQFTNGTGETIIGLAVSYTGEQWRIGGPHSTVADGMTFDYSTTTTALTDVVGYTDVPTLGFAAPAAGTAAALDGNDSGNQVPVSGTISDLDIPDGTTVTLRWTDIDASSSDDGLAIDDLSITATTGVPNLPITATCPLSIGLSPGGTASRAISATDPDGTVTAAAITSPAVTGITLGDVDPATAPGGTLTSTIEVAATAPDGTSPITVTFTNDDTPTPHTTTCTIQVSVVATSAHIRDIQGASHTSPLAGTSVTGVPGVVTGLRANGFYLQDPTSDADPATSEGVFVFTSSAPTVAVGDDVLVSGNVVEFRPTAVDGPNLTVTEISGPSIALVSSGNALPASTVIGTGGRIAPAAIDDDPSASVEDPAHVFDPTKNAIDFYESMEGMLVTVNGATVVDGSSTAVSNGEIPVLPTGAPAGTRSPRGAVLVGPYVGDDTQLSNANPGRVLLDDEILRATTGTMPAANVGDLIGTATGPLDYSFGNFKLEVTTPPAVTTVPLPREVGGAAPANGISVATYNVENLTATDSPTKFDGLAEQIVDHLRSPDLVVVEEIQDNNGTSTAGTTAADQTWAKLITAIAAAGGPTYEYRQIDPQPGTDGGAPGGNIRVGFLFRTDRGLAFVDRPGGDATAVVTVADVGGMPQLSASPGRIAPTNAAWDASRKPLVGEFTYAGRTIFVVGNHFNSKGGDEPLFGRFQPPSRPSELQRHQQATLVHDFVAQITAIDPDAEVIVAGDLNDFETSETLDILTGDLLVNMFDTLPANEQYDYVFEGNAQTLDHVLVTPALKEAGNATFDVVHVNAEYGDQLSDHDPELLSLDFTAEPQPEPQPGGRFVATGPTSLLDTRRPGQGGRLTPGVVRELRLADAPADAVGIVAQVTVVDPADDGWLKVYPCGQPEPGSSSVNYKAGSGAWAGQVTISTGNGAMCLASYAAVDIVVDGAGWLSSGATSTVSVAGTPALLATDAGAGYVPVSPHRLVDTREGIGGTRLGSGRILRVDPTTTPGWPTGATAALVQLTAVDSPEAGFLRAFPCDQDMPETSNVNTRGAGQYAYSSLTTVPLAADGSFCVFTYRASDIVVDVNGAWAASATERMLPAAAPFRVVDTREGLGGTRLAGGGTLRIPSTAWGGGTTAILNVVAVNASAGGFLTIYDCATPRPTVSNVNFPPAGHELDGHPVSNAAQVKVGAGSELCIYAFAGSSVDVVVDVSGQVVAPA